MKNITLDKKLFNQLLRCAAKNDSSYGMSGVLFVLYDTGQWDIVATDTHQLILVEIDKTNEAKKEIARRLIATHVLKSCVAVTSGKDAKAIFNPWDLPEMDRQFPRYHEVIPNMVDCVPAFQVVRNIITFFDSMLNIGVNMDHVIQWTKPIGESWFVRIPGCIKTPYMSGCTYPYDCKVTYLSMPTVLRKEDETMKQGERWIAENIN